MARFRRRVLQEHTTFEQETIEPSTTAPEIKKKKKKFLLLLLHKWLYTYRI